MISPDLIFKMREMSHEILKAAEDKMKKSGPITVIDQYESGIFEVSVVLSGEKLYELVRFFDFVFCPCRDFEFSGTACKHSWFVLPKLCKKCRERSVGNVGEKCERCSVKDAPYLKQASSKKPERVGNIII